MKSYVCDCPGFVVFRLILAFYISNIMLFKELLGPYLNISNVIAAVIHRTIQLCRLIATL